MKYQDIVVLKRWLPILKEYEKTKAKVTPRPFKYVKNICEAHHISSKDISRYYHKWIAGGRKPESLLPEKRGAKPGSRRTPKEIERNILKAYRRFGSNRYELVELFKPYYLDKTPASATMDRIKARYPLNPSSKKIIKRYEKQTPGELAHIDVTEVTKDIKMVLKIKKLYVAALCDDCTRIAYAEVIKDKKATTLAYFLARALAWFKHVYNFEFSKIMSDNGGEFKGSLEKDHAFEVMCSQLGIQHIYTKPYRPQTNGKIEAYNKILKNEFMYPNKFDTYDELVGNLGNYLFEYNHLRKHGGLNYQTPFDKLKTVTEVLPNY